MLEITDKEIKEAVSEILKNKNTVQKAMIKHFPISCVESCFFTELSVCPTCLDDSVFSFFIIIKIFLRTDKSS